MFECIDGSSRGEKCGSCGKLIMTSLAYQCDKCGHYVNVPNCLVDEVRSLYLEGVRVVTARCLRFCDTGYIQVNPGDIGKMERLGYKHLSASQLGLTTNSESFFVPKTSMPIDSIPEKFEKWEKTHSVSNQNANENVAENESFSLKECFGILQEGSFETLQMKLDFRLIDYYDSELKFNYEGECNPVLITAVAEAIEKIVSRFPAVSNEDLSDKEEDGR